jgi:hypothetical protein
MGITGTDVSKEASDMVLLDDNFTTIVAATEEGRVVYDNIRRFIKYILGSNIGEVLTIAAAPIMGLGGVPLSPLQILWMNLVTDGVPALALAMEPAEPNVMQRPPNNPRESIFARGLGAYMVRVGIVLAILSIRLDGLGLPVHPCPRLSPRPQHLENPGVYYPLPGPDGPRPGGPIQHSPDGPDESPVESLYLGSSAAHDGAADCADLRAAAARIFSVCIPSRRWNWAFALASAP